MTQTTECVNSVHLVELPKKFAEDEMLLSPQAKKLKQARLPFMPLDPKVDITAAGAVNSNSSAKKRKLSEQDSPSAKAQKTPKQSVTENHVKAALPRNENEVSSSSETDNLLLGTVLPKSSRTNILERFVRKIKQEDDISSTIDVVDLTGEDECANMGDEFDDKENAEKSICDQTTTASTEAFSDEVLEVDGEGSEKCAIIASDVCTPKRDSDASETEKLVHKAINNKIDLMASCCTIALSRIDAASSSINAAFRTPVKGDDLAIGRERTPSGNKIVTTTPVSESSSLSESRSETTPDSVEQKPKISSEMRAAQEALHTRNKELRETEREVKKRQLDDARSEKCRLRREEKEKKEKEKQEQKLIKDQERQDKRDQLEMERLAKQQQKDEERQKKQGVLEAKLEEKKKKEDEKKRKEDEKSKEEKDKIKKKEIAKASFTSFFIKPKTSPPPKAKGTSGLFMAFEMKKDMIIAPATRAVISDEKKDTLDRLLAAQDITSLYVGDTKRRPTLQKRHCPVKNGTDADVEILAHDSEVVKKVTHPVKVLQFHTNHRPPYYGTWRKNSSVISPRNPFKQDTELLDYEVDSDDEWEEEEPGESLSSSEGEDEKEEDPDQDEDEEMGDGWMVPHGYLSEDEGCEEDEEVTPELMKARQMAKAEQWESDQKRQYKPAMPRVYGPFWAGDVDNLQQKLMEKLLQYKAVCLLTEQIPTSLSAGSTRAESIDPSLGEKLPATPASRGNLRRPVPEEAMVDLIHLLHGNELGIKKIMREFLTFWKQRNHGTPKETRDEVTSMEVDNEKQEEKTPRKQVPALYSKETIGKSEFASPKICDENGEVSEHQANISKRQLEMRINAIAVREKRSTHKKVCWYVHDSVLKEYGQEGLAIPNTWQYVSQQSVKRKPDEPLTPNNHKVPNITQFTQPMSPSQLAANITSHSPLPNVVHVENKPSPRQTTSLQNDQKLIRSFFKQPTITSPAVCLSREASPITVTSIILSAESSQEPSPINVVVSTENAEGSGKNSVFVENCVIEDCIIID